MAEPVRIVGGDIDGRNNEGRQAQVDKWGALWVREHNYQQLNQTYEDTSFVAGDSPAVHDFNTDAGQNSVDGYIICDGGGDIQVDISMNGITYGDKWTMKQGECVSLLRFNINKIRITHTGSDSAYRINLI